LRAVVPQTLEAFTACGDDHDGLEKLAQYILRNPFSLEKMTYVPESGEVIYRSKRNHATQRLRETFDAAAFIAAITRHIPAPGQHLVRYYGAYNNRTRGELRKRCCTPSATKAADPLPAQILTQVGACPRPRQQAVKSC
jgi:hypothetical protein